MGLSPALVNSLAIHWIATSEPRASDMRPSSASDDRNVRLARISDAWIASSPVAIRLRVPDCAATSNGIRKTMRSRLLIETSIIVGHAGAVTLLLDGGTRL